MTQDRMFTASMVGLLKGAPLSIIVLLMLSGQPQSAQYLQRYSRYSDKVVQQALLFLQEEGLITRNARYSWQLTKYASQLPLMAQTGLEPAAGVDEEATPTLMTLTGSEPAAGEEIESQASESPPIADRDTENFRVGISDSLARVFNLDSCLNNDSRKENLASDTEKFRVLFEALSLYGIREPARSRIARIPGMTLERIEHFCETCPAGQAIYRIEHNWAVPKNAMDSLQRSNTPADEEPEIINPRGEQNQPEIPEDIQDAWDRTLDQLKTSLGRAAYANWVEVLQLGGYCGDCLTILAANQWVTDNLQGIGMNEGELGRIFSEIYGSQISAHFEIGLLW